MSAPADNYGTDYRDGTVQQPSDIGGARNNPLVAAPPWEPPAKAAAALKHVDPNPGASSEPPYMGMPVIEQVPVDKSKSDISATTIWVGVGLLTVVLGILFIKI